MKRALSLGILALLLIAMAGCAPGPNELVNSPDEDEDVAGFLTGLWHGLIAPITFIVSLFSRTVHFYEVHNNGNWYNIGYVIGVMSILGGGGGGAAARRSRKSGC